MLEFGTPAPHGRRKHAAAIAADSPETDAPLALDDTPTLLLRRVERSSPSSPAGFPGVGRARTILWTVGAVVALALFSVGVFGVSQREGVQPSAAPRRELSVAVGAEKTEGGLGQAEDQLVRIGKRVSSVEALLGDLQALAHAQANDTAALRQQLASVARLGQLTASQRVETAIPKRTEPPVAARPMLDRPVAAAPSPSRSPPPSPSRSPSVHVWFIYDANAQLGPAVDLYWLSGNSSERWYATIPAGQRADEHTYAGQCWRARTVRARGGQHVASYCATAEPTQQVHITPQSKVQLDFHYPHLPGASSLAKLSKFGSSIAAPGVVPPSRASVFQLIGTSPQYTETLVGHVAAGGHLSTSALAGSRYRVRSHDHLTTTQPTAHNAALQPGNRHRSSLVTDRCVMEPRGVRSSRWSWQGRRRSSISTSPLATLPSSSS